MKKAQSYKAKSVQAVVGNGVKKGRRCLIIKKGPSSIRSNLPSTSDDHYYSMSTDRCLIANASENWVNDIQQIMSSMESENVGFVRDLDCCKQVVDKYSQLTDSKFTIATTDPDFGKQKSSFGREHALNLCWEGQYLSGSPSRFIQFDGIPFVVIGSRSYQCSHKNESTCSRCPCRILIQEIIKFPDYGLVGHSCDPIQMCQQSNILRASLSMGKTVVYERRFYMLLSSKDMHIHTNLSNDISLSNAVKDVCSPINYGKTTTLACDQCSYRFVCRASLAVHLQSEHNTGGSVMCEICGKNFKNLCGLRSHQKFEHPDRFNEFKMEGATGTRNCTLRCQLCPVDCFAQNMRQLVLHYQREHNCPVAIGISPFNTMQEFLIWKELMEHRDGVSFVKWASGKVRSTTGIIENYYYCGWQYKAPNNSPQLRKNMSRCPAFLRLRETAINGTIAMQHCLQHIGHDVKNKAANGLPGSLICINNPFDETAPPFYECSVCGKRYSRRNTARFHAITEHCCCPLCGSDGILDIWFHLSVQHPGYYLQDINEQLVCARCDHQCTSRRLLAEHYNHNHQQTDVQIGTEVFPDIESFLLWKSKYFNFDLKGLSKAQLESTVRLVCCFSESCPVFLNFYFYQTRGAIAAEYCTTHVDHDLAMMPVEGIIEGTVESIDKLREMVKLYFSTVTQDRTFDTAVQRLVRVSATPKAFRCTSCFAQFDKSNELELHCASVHKQEVCKLCDRKFATLKNLQQHCASAHPQIRSHIPMNLVCPLCSSKIDQVENLAQHYSDHHGMTKCRTMSRSFNNGREFFKWKVEMEMRDFAYFAKRKKMSFDDEHVLFFACSFGWVDHRRGRKGKTSERHCPAYIKASTDCNGETVRVGYCFHHVGHELTSENFWRQVQRSLNGVLSFGHKINNSEKTSDSNGAVDPGPSTSGNSLDDQMGIYWEMIVEKQAQNGQYSLTTARRINDDDTSNDFDDRFCHICHVAFKNHRTMVRHVSRVHDPSKSETIVASKYSKPVRCLFCNMKMAPPQMKNLIQHYINGHQQPIELKMRLFKSQQLFDLWREEVTGTFFKRVKVYRSACGEVRQYWTCRCSGSLCNPIEDVTEGHCPAWIFSQSKTDHTVQVSYCLYHIGHSLDSKVNRRSVETVPVFELGKPALDPLEYELIDEHTSMEIEQQIYKPSQLQVGSDLQEEQIESFAQPPLPWDQQIRANALEKTESIVVVDGEISMNGIGGDSNAVIDPVAPAEGSPVIEPYAAALGQMQVRVWSVDGSYRIVSLPLQQFPVIVNDGQSFYSVENEMLLQVVGEILEQNQMQLNEGDRLEIFN